MPGNSEHPVTLGDLQVNGPNSVVAPFGYRPATVADLVSPEIRPLVVSALRAEGVLVVEKVDREWLSEFLPTIAVALRVGAKKGRTVPQLDINEQQAYALADAVLVALDALAEAQPFPPAGDVL